jgi:prepilin-type N-terminal cleavage/methylation domain-containing protein
MKRSRGMTLIEIMIAMLLAGIVSAFILMIMRSQLIAYEQNDQVARMQQNERAGLAIVETLLRRACGGIAQGRIQNEVGTPKLVDCVNVTEPNTNNGTDQVDITYGSSPWTAVSAYDITSASPSATVANASSFSKNDYVLLTDFNQAMLFQISGIATTISPQAKISLGSATPTNPFGAFTPTYLMKVVSYTIYVQKTSTVGLENMLMLDPQGITGDGVTHPSAQPIVENVVDFQLSLGLDNNSDGTITEVGKAAADDEWYGNVNGELPLAVAQWGSGTNPKWIRLSLIFQTSNKYPGTVPTLPLFEDRTTAVATTTSGGIPRYRSVRITLAPRAWNLTN